MNDLWIGGQPTNILAVSFTNVVVYWNTFEDLSMRPIEPDPTFMDIWGDPIIWGSVVIALLWVLVFLRMLRAYEESQARIATQARERWTAQNAMAQAQRWALCLIALCLTTAMRMGFSGIL